MSEWQPIETAPRDGTHILLYVGEFGGEERFVGYYEPSEVPAGYERNRERWRGTYPHGPFVWRCVPDGGVAEEIPTHWVPLPDPPK